MKFGIGFWLSQKPRKIIDLVKLTDKLGFESAWFNDHYFLHDTFIVQAIAAVTTQRIAFGNAIVSPFIRHPAALASSVSTISQLSGGRAILGIGAGGYEFPTHLHLDISKPLTASREAIEIIKALWTGKKVSYHGKIFKITNARLWDSPKYEIPIYLGARGARMLQMGGENCQGIVTHGVSERYIKFVKENVQKGTAKAGRLHSTVDIATYTRVFITDDIEKTINQVKTAAAIMAGGDYSDELLEVFELDRNKVRNMRKALIESNFTEIARQADAHTVNSFLIVGNAEECRKKIESLQKVGLTHIIMGVRELPGHSLNAKEAEHTIRLISKEIVEPLRGKSRK